MINLSTNTAVFTLVNINLLFTFRKKNRVSLQQQIQEHDDNYQRHLKDRYKESDFAINYDKACLQQDAVDKYDRLTYLKTFRDENKKVFCK